MNETQKQIAQDSMIEWLADSHELGKQPHAIECAGSFDLYDMKYYIFKYKKTLLGKWLIGVCGGYETDSTSNCGHVFSNMMPYSADTAKQDAIEMIELVRSYWKKQAENYKKDE